MHFRNEFVWFGTTECAPRSRGFPGDRKSIQAMAVRLAFGEYD
jgi:hypothetical protein